jgi:hypothetical protein
VFYGVKAVRFYMASHSQLKYGARLINSYLGNNATISCCEVLNSLIFPAHEQHHNNSFLCAATVLGQSNIAAGATLGSNHNSRSADGELIAGRGFWPALCVSIKHNSKFATYTLLAKGDYPAELNIPIPFSLVNNDESKNQLTVMPGYWFLYNMYALARNVWKYIDRDKREDKTQLLEYDFLAPDSVNEIFESLRLMELFTGKAALKKEGATLFAEDECIAAGKKLLNENSTVVDTLEITADGFENSKRHAVLLKTGKSYSLFRELIYYYAAVQLLQLIEHASIKSFNTLLQHLPVRPKRRDWENAGGQLIEKEELNRLKERIVTGKIKSWDAVHEFYRKQSEAYAMKKLEHSLASLYELTNTKKMDKAFLKSVLQQYLQTKEWMVKGIHDSREKDYTNSFRKMVYENDAEMEAVTGKFAENSFIQQQQTELKVVKKAVQQLMKTLQL